jgi:hypothetical protein
MALSGDVGHWIRGRLQDGWHGSLRHEQYRVTITMSGYGSDEEAAEKLLQGHRQSHSEVEPAVSRDSGDDTIAVTVTVSAGSQYEALDFASEMWVAGGRESGIEPGQILRAEVVRVRDRHTPEFPLNY